MADLCVCVSSRSRETEINDEWRSAFKKTLQEVERTVEPLLQGWLQYARDGMFKKKSNDELQLKSHRQRSSVIQ